MREILRGAEGFPKEWKDRLVERLSYSHHAIQRFGERCVGSILPTFVVVKQDNLKKVFVNDDETINEVVMRIKYFGKHLYLAINLDNSSVKTLYIK